MQSSEEMQRLCARQRGPEARLAWHIRHPPMCFHRITLTVDAEDRRTPAGRTDQSEQEPDRRRLSRTVRTQIADGLTFSDLQVQRGQRIRLAEPLGELLYPDRRRSGTPPTRRNNRGRCARATTAIRPGADCVPRCLAADTETEVPRCPRVRRTTASEDRKCWVFAKHFATNGAVARPG